MKLTLEWYPSHRYYYYYEFTGSRVTYIIKFNVSLVTPSLTKLLYHLRRRAWLDMYNIYKLGEISPMLPQAPASHTVIPLKFTTQVICVSTLRRSFRSSYYSAAACTPMLALWPWRRRVNLLLGIYSVNSQVKPNGVLVIPMRNVTNIATLEASENISVTLSMWTCEWQLHPATYHAFEFLQLLLLCTFLS